jgi:centromere protein I
LKVSSQRSKGDETLRHVDLYESTFQPLEYAILDDSPDSQVALLKFYTSILRQWTVSLLSSSPPTAASLAITALTTHANKLALTLLQTSPTTTAHDHILAFYEITAYIISRPSLQSHVRITTPPATLIYTLHFSPSLSTLSRLCAILAIYKRAFESAMSKAAPAATGPSNSAGPTPQTESYPKDYVNLFNGFLMDICNCVWRTRAFNKADTNALGCLLPPPLLPILTTYVAKLDTGLALPSLFSLSYSPVLCNLSISYVRELEDKEVVEAPEGTMTPIQIRHAGPVTQRSLLQLEKDGGLKLAWQNYRLGVLRYLEAKGVMGVGELMYNTLKHLMTAREGVAKT